MRNRTMPSAVAYFSLLLFAATTTTCVAQQSPTSPDKDKPVVIHPPSDRRPDARPTAGIASGELRKFLEGKGYVRYPLRRDDFGSLYIAVTIGGKERVGLLDTGATATVMSDRLAKELDLDLTRERRRSEAIGGSVWMRESHVPKSLATSSFCFAADVFVYENYDKVIPSKSDLLIGMNVLRYHNAVIDATEPALYTLDPFKVETRLDGEWQLVASTREGEELAKEDLGDGKLMIKGDELVHRGRDGSTLRFALFLSDLDKETRGMTWRWMEGPGQHMVIYKVDGDLLTVCGNFTGSKAMKQPTKFASTKDNGMTINQFRRVKAEKK
jgi:uncharacterized protein (TIGR03067 family)